MKNLLIKLLVKLCSTEKLFEIALKIMYQTSSQVNSHFSYAHETFHRVSNRNSLVKSMTFHFFDDSRGFKFLEKYEDRKYDKNLLEKNE